MHIPVLNVTRDQQAVVLWVPSSMAGAGLHCTNPDVPTQCVVLADPTLCAVPADPTQVQHACRAGTPASPDGTVPGYGSHCHTGSGVE